jgi:DNA-binding NtrC family response regulator
MEETVLGKNRVTVIGGTLTRANDTEPALVIGTEPRIIGRDPGCDLVVDDRLVSAAHVELVATDRGVRLKDTSRNGTFVDDMRVESVYLTKAATIRIGTTTLRFTPATERVAARASSFGRLLGETPVMRTLFERLKKAAKADGLAVLVTGETGTGKELVARSIHEEGPRAKGPFVVVDCAALTPTLAEGLLFGHEKGAFTGASERRISPFLEADGGTVFLDELGELPLDMQPKLLRVLQEREVKSVGSNKYRKFDARVIAATNRDLAPDMNGAFRTDLFFRVAQVRVQLPPLRERRDDILPLVEFTTKQIAVQRGEPDAFPRINRESLVHLAETYHWPGNVRELGNLVSRAVWLDTDGEIDLAAHLDEERASASVSAASQAWTAGALYDDAKREALDDFQRKYLSELVERCGGNLSEVSRQSGLSRPQVYEIIRRHALTLPSPVPARPSARKARPGSG